MEMYKSLVICKISNEEERESLKMNCCDMVLNAFQKNLFMPCQWRYIR